MLHRFFAISMGHNSSATEKKTLIIEKGVKTLGGTIIRRRLV